MKIRHLIPILAALLAFALVTGCAQTPPTPPPQTTVKTAPPTTVPAATLPPTAPPTIVKTPQPVQTLPPMYNVEVQVDSNGVSIDPKVIATYRGGQGTNFVTRIDVILTRDDGVVKTGAFTPPLHVGQTIELESTTGNNNRVEVYVSLSTGDRYKTYDQIVPFRAFH